MVQNQQQRRRVISPFITAFNKLHGEKYRIEANKECSWIVIRPTGDDLSGCFVKDFALLASAYDWSFGIHTDHKGIYILF